MSILPIKLLSENAILPTRANPTDSGLDLYVAEDTTIPAHSTVVVPTHIAIDLAYGYEAQVRPRSGNSLKTKLRVALGTIDHTYNKEIGIITDNIGDEAIVVKAGTRLAQLVVTPVMLPEPTEVQEFDEESERGAYGSTGSKDIYQRVKEVLGSDRTNFNYYSLTIISQFGRNDCQNVFRKYQRRT